MRYIIGMALLCGIGYLIIYICLKVSEKGDNLRYKLDAATVRICDLQEELENLRKENAELKKRLDIANSTNRSYRALLKEKE